MHFGVERPSARKGDRTQTPTDLPSFEVPGFTGYTDLDGASLPSEQAAMHQFNQVRGFVSVNEQSGDQEESPRSPEIQKVDSVPSSDTDAAQVRQRALELPKGLSEDALHETLKIKLAEFATYFDQKWKGRDLFQERNSEKDADLECLATLQGRIAACRVRIQKASARSEQEGVRQEELARIAHVELEQIRGDVLSEQGKLLAEWNGAPTTAIYQRRRLYNKMRQLSGLLKPENEQALRDWWNEGAYVSEDFLSASE